MASTQILPEAEMTSPMSTGDSVPVAWGGWSTSPKPPPPRLSDIMSEQLATSLQSEEEKRFVVETLLDSPHPDDALELNISTEDTSSDFMIAQMLQIQFSRQHDDNLRREEQKYNGGSKVSVSLNKYLMSPPGVDSDSDDEEDLPPSKTWDSFEAHEKAFPQMSKAGYVKVNNELVTKHDVTMNQRRNACRVMESLPPCIQTGDAGSFDMQLSNKVYNKLRAYSKAEENRRNRHHDKKEKSTSDLAIDTKTRLLLYKLINATILENVCGIISTGKEAVVLFAKGGSGEEVDQQSTHNSKDKDSEPKKMVIPYECAVKVFKTSLNEFKTRDKYIRDDYRFKDRFSKQNPRKVIHMWAEKEMHNLSRIARAGIPCPSVVVLKKHVLVLSFIGSDCKPAPKLKDVKFEDDEELSSAYKQTVDMMIRLYKQCSLVHADLSEYNILWHEGKCVVIDVSQSVEPNHPNALEFLYRDCSNIANFFAKRGIKHCHTPESLFKEVCDLELDAVGGAEVINQIQDYEKNLELLTFAQTEKPFAFDYCWEQTAGVGSLGKSPPKSPKSTT